MTYNNFCNSFSHVFRRKTRVMEGIIGWFRGKLSLHGYFPKSFIVDLNVAKVEFIYILGCLK